MIDYMLELAEGNDLLKNKILEYQSYALLVASQLEGTDYSADVLTALDIILGDE